MHRVKVNLVADALDANATLAAVNPRTANTPV